MRKHMKKIAIILLATTLLIPIVSAVTTVPLFCIQKIKYIAPYEGQTLEHGLEPFRFHYQENMIQFNGQTLNQPGTDHQRYQELSSQEAQKYSMKNGSLWTKSQVKFLLQDMMKGTLILRRENGLYLVKLPGFQKAVNARAQKTPK